VSTSLRLVDRVKTQTYGRTNERTDERTDSGNRIWCILALKSDI